MTNKRRRRDNDGPASTASTGERRQNRCCLYPPNPAKRRQRNCCAENRPKVIISSFPSRFLAMFVVCFSLSCGGKGRVDAQSYADGGDVTLSCSEICYCQGTADDGSEVVVFDNPSSAERVAKVAGEYSAILESSCGTYVVASGSTLYELIGVEDLQTREMEVIAMSTSACDDTSSTSDCYSGESSNMELSSGVFLSFFFDLTISADDTKSSYQSKVAMKVEGASEVDSEFDLLCLEEGFLSHLTNVVIGTSTYYFNFELAVSGIDQSADLSVAAAPDDTAGAFICGEEVAAPTPAPVSAPPPTSAPVAPDTPEPTPAPTATPPLPTPSPVARKIHKTPQPAQDTDAPVLPLTAEPTLAPVLQETIAPTNAVTIAPVPAVSVTYAPVTLAPSGTAREVPTSPPSPASTTSSPADNATVMPSPAVVPTPAPTTAIPATIAPLNSEDEELACKLPANSTCWSSPSFDNITAGYGSYYDPRCNTTLAGDSNSGCSSDVCRSCLYNTDFWHANNPGDLPDLVECPCCVSDHYFEPAANEDGPRCESVSSEPPTMAPTLAPSKTSIPSQPIAVEDTLSFNDTGGRINSSEGVALAALGLFAVLTFFPFFSH